MKLRAIILFVIVPLLASAQNTEAFVKVKDGRFVRNGKPYFFVGANYWQGMNLGGNQTGSDPARLRRELDQMKDIGIKNLRVMAITEGPDNSPYRILPAVQNEPGVLDANMLKGLDVLLDELKKRDMTAVLVLNNFWQWSGGMAQYVKWHTGDSIPYPPPHWNGSWDRYQKYTARFYSIPEAVKQFQVVVRSLLDRVNSVSGMRYKDDPTIMAWELANEPRGIDQTGAFYQWISATAHFIKQHDHHHLVTTGAEGYTASPEFSGTDFKKMHEAKSIDYTTAHIWIQNWNWYDPARHDSTYSEARKKMLVYLLQHAKESAELGKPFVLEEFGIMKDGGSFDPAATTRHRDGYYKEVFDAVYQLAQQGHAAGVNFWAWGGEGRPRQPEAWWKKGDAFTGDPPHEPQGWYSVYNIDVATHRVIREYAAKFQAPQGQ